MASATVAGSKYNVRVVQDLADNWSLEVYERPKPPPPKAGPAAAKAAEVKAPDETEP